MVEKNPINPTPLSLQGASLYVFKRRQEPSTERPRIILEHAKANPSLTTEQLKSWVQDRWGLAPSTALAYIREAGKLADRDRRRVQTKEAGQVQAPTEPTPVADPKPAGQADHAPSADSIPQAVALDEAVNA